MADTGLHIVVVGGGLVGLTTAAALAQAGHVVTVLEQRPDLSERGTAVSIQPAASKCLEYLGIKEELEAVSVPCSSFTWWSYKEGKPMSVIPFPKISDTTRYQTERPVLQKTLYDLAVNSGASVQFGKTVTRIENSEQPRVWTEDGDEYAADLVVGADGKKHLPFPPPFRRY